MHLVDGKLGMEHSQSGHWNPLFQMKKVFHIPYEWRVLSPRATAHLGIKPLPKTTSIFRETRAGAAEVFVGAEFDLL